MTLSENLVRHFYVATEDKTAGLKAVDLSAETEGAIALAQTKDCESLYFQHKGMGGITRSDLIPVKNVHFVHLTKEEAMEKQLKTATIKLSDDVLEDGKVAAGEYIVRITIYNYIGMSDEDTYFKYGQVISNGNLTAEKFYEKLGASLKKNLSREVVALFDVEASADSVVITEKEQPWRLGLMARTQVLFDVELVMVNEMFNAPEVEGNVTTYDWGTVEKGVSDEPLKNSKDIADMEYFLMGERADIYRGKGWPLSIPTEYMVKGGSEDGYDVLDIHYSYIGSNESCQQSEKTITIVSEAGSGVLDTIVANLEDAVVGLKVKVTPAEQDSEDGD